MGKLDLSSVFVFSNNVLLSFEGSFLGTTSGTWEFLEGDYNTSNSTITEVKGEEPDNLKLNSPIKEVKGEEQPIVKPSISTITEDNQSAANQLNNHTQNTADKSGSEIKPPERRRRRFITREKENEEVNTSVTPDITQIVPSTGTPTRTRTRRSMLNQSNEENTTPPEDLTLTVCSTDLALNTDSAL
jgi:hypothetical protein